MVRKVIQVVYKEVRTLHQAAYVLAVLTFGSQILALIRDRLLAHEFGAGVELDLYYAAFRIPDLLYVIFASTLSVYVLIPFVAERIKGADFSRAQALLSQVFSTFLWVYAALAIVIAAFAPMFIPLLFPGFSEHTDTLVLLVRILLLQPFFLGISSLFGVVTQYQYRFVLYALSPLIYNIGIIFGLVVLYPSYGIYGLTWGVVIGALGHLLIQLPWVIPSGLLPRLVPHIEWGEIRSVLRVSVPRALTLSLHQIVLLGLVGFASMMAAGSVSVFQFGFNLQSVPLAIIGMSYSVAAFPLLAKLYAENKIEEFSVQITTVLRHIIFWSLPAVALLVVIRAQLVRVIFGTGAFDWDDTRLTAAVLALFALSLVAQSIHLVIVRALYASGSTRLPFYTTLLSSIGILSFSWLLYIAFTTSLWFQTWMERIMRVEGIEGTEVLMLPLGYTIALLIHICILLGLSRRRLGITPSKLISHTLQALLAAIVGGAAAYLTLNVFADPLQTETLLGIFAQGFAAGVAGIVASGLVYYVFKNQEFAEVSRALHTRFTKPKVVAPQDEDHLAV